jgi:hypothetical protein
MDTGVSRWIQILIRWIGQERVWIRVSFAVFLHLTQLSGAGDTSFKSFVVPWL